MEFKLADMENLQNLCKMSFTADEMNTASDNMVFWINKFEKMSAIDVEGVAPLISPADLSNVFREDVSYKMVSRQDLLRNAPEESNGYFKTPKTI